MWNKLFLRLKTFLGTCKIWLFRKSRSRHLKESKSKVVTSLNTDLLDEQLQEIAENFDDEISISVLEDKIKHIETKKRTLSIRQRNKYNNKLDQLLLRASARLNRLRQLSFEEIDIERILILQKSLAKKNNGKFIKTINVDFDSIRDGENIISKLDMTQESFYPEKIMFQYPNEIETELSKLLNDLRIDNTFSDDDLFWHTTDEIATEQDAYGELENSNRHDEIEKIISYLKSHGIYHFYHVTNVKNISSIDKNGLYSWTQLNANKIEYYNLVADERSRNLDIKARKEDYVRLSFCESSPMFHSPKKKYLQTNIVYRISIECLRECEFEFSDMNATDSLKKIGTGLAFLMENVRLQLFKFKHYELDDMNKKYYQAEILIKRYIPKNHIIDKIPF